MDFSQQHENVYCSIFILFLYFYLLIIYMLRLQSINCLVRVSFAIKNEAGRWVEAKKFGFFVKNSCILPVSYLTTSAKQMLFQPPMYHQNKSEGVCFYLVISVYICLFALSVLIVYARIYLRIHGLFQTVRAQVRYFGHIFFGKNVILFPHTPETDAISNHF